MSLGSYLYNLFRGVDELGNATLDGNSRQTISSRAYEAAIIQKRWYWRPVYHAINALNYGLQIVSGRKTYNHCRDAYLSDVNDRTYS